MSINKFNAKTIKYTIQKEQTQSAVFSKNLSLKKFILNPMKYFESIRPLKSFKRITHKINHHTLVQNGMNKTEPSLDQIGNTKVLKLNVETKNNKNKNQNRSKICKSSIKKKINQELRKTTKTRNSRLSEEKLFNTGDSAVFQMQDLSSIILTMNHTESKTKFST